MSHKLAKVAIKIEPTDKVKNRAMYLHKNNISSTRGWIKSENKANFSYP